MSDLKKDLLQFIDGKSQLSPHHVENAVDLFMDWLKTNTLKIEVDHTCSYEHLMYTKQHNNYDEYKRFQDAKAAQMLGSELMNGNFVEQTNKSTEFGQITRYSVVAFKNKFGQWNVNFWSVEGKNQFSPEIDLIVEIKPKTRFFGYLVDSKDSNDVEILLSSNEHLTLARFPDMDQDIEVTWK